MMSSARPAVYADPHRMAWLAGHRVPDDAALWAGLALVYPGPILEIGTGTGRVAVALAREGHDVTGLDDAPALLEAAAEDARAAGVALTLVQADMRDFALDQRFRLILVPYHTFHHLLTIEDIQAFLRCAGAHLADDGLLVIDAFQPSLAFLGGDPETRRLVLAGHDPSTGRHLRLFEENHYDPVTQINRIAWFWEIDGQPDAERDTLFMRIVFPEELRALLALGGFEVAARYGGHDLRPFDAASPQQLVVARKARARG